MERNQAIDSMLADFMKYLPAQKKQECELILRRCNFADPNDPMFSVLLFLLFLQENFADRIKAETDSLSKNADTIRVRKTMIIILLLLILLLQLFIKFDTPDQNLPVSEQHNEYSINDIQQLNRYWDIKLQQQAEKGKIRLMDTSSITHFFTLTLIIAGLLLVMIIGQFALVVAAIRRTEILEKSIREITLLRRNLTRLESGTDKN